MVSSSMTWDLNHIAPGPKGKRERRDGRNGADPNGARPNCACPNNANPNNANPNNANPNCANDASQTARTARTNGVIPSGARSAEARNRRRPGREARLPRGVRFLASAAYAAPLGMTAGRLVAAAGSEQPKPEAVGKQRAAACSAQPPVPRSPFRRLPFPVTKMNAGGPGSS